MRKYAPFLVCAALAAAAFWQPSPHDGGQASPAQPLPAAAAQAAPAEYRAGEWFEIGGFSARVNGSRLGDVSGVGPYLLVDLDVLNRGLRSEPFAWHRYYVSDAEGRIFEQTSEAVGELMLAGYEPIYWSDAQPDIPRNGVAWFRVPDRVRTYYLVVENPERTSAARVALLPRLE